jgi:LmbE family N-acetylglucosaminyl deacetylase
MSKAEQCHCLFLAPHLDDVTLSCALRLIKERQEGRTVLVATVFSNSLSLLPGKDLYEGRRREDKDALQILGIRNPVWLGFRDAPFRNWFYWNFESIVLGKHQSDACLTDKISTNVMSLCREYAPQRIFLPLAIGTHIDHRLVHQLWCSLPSDADIVFYEDRPYVFVPQSLTIRMAEIQAVSVKPEAVRLCFGRHNSLRSFAEGLKEVSLYKNVLKNKRERFRYMLWAGRKLKLVSGEPRLKVEPEVIVTTDLEDLKQIAEAISTYKSQMKLLYENLTTFDLESTKYAQILDPTSIYAERYWKLVR